MNKNIKNMSNSKRKTPKFGCAGSSRRNSEKEDKKRANKLFRTKCRDLDPTIEETIFPNKMREVSDNWTFFKDGKVYISEATGKMMRK